MKPKHTKQDILGAIEAIERLRALGYEPFVWTEHGQQELRFKNARGSQTKKERQEFVWFYERMDRAAGLVVINLQNKSERRYA